jgi:hypothetical protein
MKKIKEQIKAVRERWVESRRALTKEEIQQRLDDMVKAGVMRISGYKPDSNGQLVPKYMVAVPLREAEKRMRAFRERRAQL